MTWTLRLVSFVLGLVPVFMLGFALFFAAHSAEIPKGSFLTKQFDLDKHPRITVIGDSIALGTGEHLCRALPNCHVHAAVGRQSFQTIRHVDVYADIIVISVCTNDPTPSECARNVTILRQSVASDTKVIWIVPAWPKWAHDMVIATASGFADGSVIFVAGCCSVQARRHPRSYKAVADDVLLALGALK